MLQKIYIFEKIIEMATELSGVLLIFLMGLRHGVAADHIAVIDGLGMHLHHQGKSRMVPWLGTLFAVGHGIIITVFISFANLGIGHLPVAAFRWLDWIPALLLFMIAFLNLRTLLSKKPEMHTGFFVTAPPGQKPTALSAVLVSVCMVMVFDTLADAGAWGYSAAACGSWWTALLLGSVFTLGMVITDTVDSRLLAKTIEKAPGNQKVKKQRRILCWVIVVFSFALGIQKLFTAVDASFALPEVANLMIGLLLVLIVATSYIGIYRSILAK